MSASDERGCYLDFEEIRWRVQKHFIQLEFFIMDLNKRQGDINQTEKLFNEFNVNEIKLKIQKILHLFVFRGKFTRKKSCMLLIVYYRN